MSRFSKYLGFFGHGAIQFRYNRKKTFFIYFEQSSTVVILNIILHYIYIYIYI